MLLEVVSHFLFKLKFTFESVQSQTIGMAGVNIPLIRSDSEPLKCQNAWNAIGFSRQPAPLCFAWKVGLVPETMEIWFGLTDQMTVVGVTCTKENHTMSSFPGAMLKIPMTCGATKPTLSKLWLPCGATAHDLGAGHSDKFGCKMV